MWRYPWRTNAKSSLHIFCGYRLHRRLACVCGGDMLLPQLYCLADSSNNKSTKDAFLLVPLLGLPRGSTTACRNDGLRFELGRTPYRWGPVTIHQKDAFAVCTSSSIGGYQEVARPIGGCFVELLYSDEDNKAKFCPLQFSWNFFSVLKICRGLRED